MAQPVSFVTYYYYRFFEGRRLGQRLETVLIVSTTSNVLIIQIGTNDLVSMGEHPSRMVPPGALWPAVVPNAHRRGGPFVNHMVMVLQEPHHFYRYGE